MPAKVVFSTALVTPDMRVGEEPHDDDLQDIIIAILAPHDLTLSVGLRRILLSFARHPWSNHLPAGALPRTPQRA